MRFIETRFFVIGGYVDADFLLAGILAVFLRRRWIPLLIVSAVSIDILDCFARTYYFSPADIPYALESVASFPAQRLAGYALVLLIVLTGLILPAMVLRRSLGPERRWRPAIALLIIGCFLFGIDMWGEYRAGGRRGDAAVVHRLVRVPEWTLLLQAHRAILQSSNSYAAIPQARFPETATSRGLSLLNVSADPVNIVDILVESWGHDQQGTFDQKLLAFYHSPEIQNRYRIVTGTVPFTGGTVAGETRELCRSPLATAVVHASSSELADCVPFLLRRQGYHTESVHGYVSHMFERYRWHPRVGFEQSWFRPELHLQGLSDCTDAFRGICDDQIAAWIGDHLREQQAAKAPPDFLFWITLNSHLPVPAHTEDLNPVSCAFDPLLAAKEPICAWFKLEYEVHKSIAALAEERDLPSTAFFIVGDHAPPFHSPDMRSRFSQSVVPFVLLIPRTSTAEPGSVDVSHAPASSHHPPA